MYIVLLNQHSISHFMINIIKKKYFKNKRGTALAIGPVSKNTIIAANLASKEKNVPLMLISSRRQIETKKYLRAL